MSITMAPVTLQGRLVRLEPLSRAHHDGLVGAAKDGSLWDRWWTSIPSPDQVQEAIDRRIELAAAGTMLPFVTVATDGTVLGMTSFYDPVPDVPRISIGWTWNRASAHRTGTNADSKLLLMTHAFETWQVQAVRFETSWSNRQSRGAIERLGARRDGVLRAHRRESNGTLGDLVIYSVLQHEWPSVRAGLEHRVAQRTFG